MPATRMDSRIELLEDSVSQISTLRATVNKLKGDLEHLNARLEMELGKMNEGLLALVKMIKGRSLETSDLTGEGSGTKSVNTVENPTELEPFASGKAAENSFEGNYRKLELPLFNVVDPDSWIFRAERYFNVNKIAEAERVVVAGVCMERSASSWFQWEEGRHPIRSWTELKQRVLVRFRDPQYGTLHQQFLAIRQTGRVAEFREQFEIMAAPLKNVSEDTLEGVFINGLVEEVQAEVLMANSTGVLMANSTGLSQIMDMAQRVEDRNNRVSKVKERKRPRVRSIPAPMPVKFEQRTFSWNLLKGTTLPEKMGNNLSNAIAGFKWLSQVEIQAKKEKELCFRCDEKYTIGHRCRNKEL
ncbi:uncharacterized protein LOC111367934 [Olea europaea var. sylvestris]|uniref:uncharacterized protein LOC111367934 n=1 Tax=Olea europaea var. sylvestris TaxID=158386 RepID=UPI000C1D5180|nr:uncharacterized protein LOC111367934 [Olea europaea var. sylvestris]XP_022844825.1 uncharacterized protein LOC111367934 [Olea europaea var. sylvestris]